MKKRSIFKRKSEEVLFYKCTVILVSVRRGASQTMRKYAPNESTFLMKKCECTYTTEVPSQLP